MHLPDVWESSSLLSTYLYPSRLLWLLAQFWRSCVYLAGLYLSVAFVVTLFVMWLACSHGSYATGLCGFSALMALFVMGRS